MKERVCFSRKKGEIVLFIDANIFLEVCLNQAKSLECQALLTYLETANPCCFITSFHIFSIILVIQHKSPDINVARKFIEAFQSYSGIDIYNPGFATMTTAINNQAQYNLDFDDGLVIASMQDLNITELVSFDTHFDSVSLISRIDPTLALEKLQGA